MFAVIKEIHFCYGHRLLNYDGKCRHLHGHNGRVEIELRKDGLDALGMVMDFEAVKRTVQAWIDSELDHKMLLCKDDPAVPLLKGQGEPMILMDGNPTAETIARLIFDHAKGQGLPVASVRLWETPGSSAVYTG
jgi:6-pyruvoyltetrahydropterin/6-carboxytetrahydropterin synthase